MWLSLTRFGADAWVAAWRKASIEPWAVIGVYALAWVMTLWLTSLYQNRIRWSARSEALDICRAGVVLAVLTFSALFILKLPEVSRLFLLVLFPAQVGVTLVVRAAMRVGFRVARTNGHNYQFVLVVGADETAQGFADRIERHRELGLRVIGHLEWSGADQRPPVTRPILGNLDDIEEVLHTPVVDEVAICLPRPTWGLIDRSPGSARRRARSFGSRCRSSSTRSPAGRARSSTGCRSFARLRARPRARPRREARRRHRRLGRRARRPEPGHAGDLARDPARDGGPDPVPPGTRRPARPDVPRRQVPDDGRRTPRTAR